MKNNFFKLLFALAVVCTACEPQRSKEEVAREEITYKEAPSFNQDSAYAYIQQQVDFGPRVPNTSSHAATRQWLIAKFEEFGWNVTPQEFTATTHDGLQWDLTNIVATYNPEATKRILLAAHWDTRRVADKDSERQDEPIPGANDGGSGVGLLLEVARTIGEVENKPEVGVDIILFDGEDDGEPETKKNRSQSTIWWCLGSQHWSKNKHEPSYSAYFGILVDMVGGRGARFYKEGYSMQYAKNVVDKVWKYGHHLGHSDFFIMRQSEPITDDHLFVNEIANIPMINIIEYSPDFGFGHYHHTHADDMDLIDKRTLKAVGETVLFAIYQE